MGAVVAAEHVTPGLRVESFWSGRHILRVPVLDDMRLPVRVMGVPLCLLYTSRCV